MALAGGGVLPQVPDHALLMCIGRGGYGEVWLAQNVLGTFRAIKIVHRSHFQDDQPYEREFAGIRKYEPVSRSHPGLMQVLHVGRNDEDRCFYYVMDLADAIEDTLPEPSSGSAVPPGGLSKSLFDPGGYSPKTLKALVRGRGRLSYEECLQTTLALAAALDHLHKHGLVHRDIKPSNVIFVNGTPKLANIGLVTDTDATMSYVGTEGFVAPEGPGKPQADIYSLGKLLYEVATGKDRLHFPEPLTSLTPSPSGGLQSAIRNPQ